MLYSDRNVYCFEEFELCIYHEVFFFGVKIKSLIEAITQIYFQG